MAIELTLVRSCNLADQNWQTQHSARSIFQRQSELPMKSSEVNADYILISHGHFDHIVDAVSIAHRTRAHVVAIYEIAQWLNKNHNVDNSTGMNIGTRQSLI